MKKWQLIVCSIVAVVLLAACGNKVDEETENTYVEKAEAIVHYLNEGKFDQVFDKLNASMQSQVTAEQLAEIKPVLEASGDYEGIEKQSVEEKDNIKVVVIVGKHSEENRIYTVSYDESDEIAGLFVQ